jgi:tetratricopeptide (TPR) repeat protein
MSPDVFNTEGNVSVRVVELAQEIKEKGRRSIAELPPLLQKAEQLAEDQTQDSLTRALAHRAAGNALQLLNQFEPALDHYNRASNLLELLDEPTELGRTLLAKVGFLFHLGRFDELFACAERARALFETVGDRHRLGRLQTNLAYAYFRLDRHKESLACSEEALAVLEAVADMEGALAATINSAVTLSSMHEFERAEERFQKALRLANDLNMPAAALLSRFNLAYLRYLAGDTGEALSEFARLRKEYEAAKEERQMCLCWLDEAEILLEIGDLEESIHAACEARSLAQKLGLNYEIGKSLLFEAAAGLRLGRQEGSLELLQDATRRFEAEGNRVLSAVSRLQAALFRGECGAAQALSEAAAARAALRSSGLPHRLALADIVIGRIQRANKDTVCAIDSFNSALSIAQTSRSKWMQFHALYELGLCLIGKDDIRSNELFRQAEGLLDSLWDRLGSDELKMAFLGDRENVYTYLVQSAISDSPETAFEFSEKAHSRVLGERLIRNASFGSAAAMKSHLSQEESIVEYFIAGDDLCIFVLGSNALQSIQRRGAVSRLKAAWENLDRHLSSCSVKWERLGPAQRHLEATALSHLQDLYSELIEPVRSELRRSVVFVPNGFLHGIPLHALHDGERFLMESHRISYSPSASLYCAPPSEQPFHEPLFIAFSRNGRTSSVDEVEQVAPLVPDSRVLINPSLLELRLALDSPRTLIHIAGHAGIDMVDGKLSWIETPDGRLTSRDLLDMQIRARTLVITGCQTARRLIRPGDEWLGLMRAFYMSGATTIVSALWNIRDESARRFSSEFYSHFGRQDAPSAAQKACESLRTWQSHPYFWAGFGVFVRKNS